MVNVIENADLGIVPKRSIGFGNEAFSTKILEFMAMGIPVIVPDTEVDTYYFDEKVAKFFRANDEIKPGRRNVVIDQERHSSRDAGAKRERIRQEVHLGRKPAHLLGPCRCALEL